MKALAIAAVLVCAACSQPPAHGEYRSGVALRGGGALDFVELDGTLRNMGDETLPYEQRPACLEIDSSVSGSSPGEITIHRIVRRRDYWAPNGRANCRFQGEATFRGLLFESGEGVFFFNDPPEDQNAWGWFVQDLSSNDNVPFYVRSLPHRRRKCVEVDGVLSQVGEFGLSSRVLTITRVLRVYELPLLSEPQRRAGEWPPLVTAAQVGACLR